MQPVTWLEVQCQRHAQKRPSLANARAMRVCQCHRAGRCSKNTFASWTCSPAGWIFVVTSQNDIRRATSIARNRPTSTALCSNERQQPSKRIRLLALALLHVCAPWFDDVWCISSLDQAEKLKSSRWRRQSRSALSFWTGSALLKACISFARSTHSPSSLFEVWRRGMVRPSNRTDATRRVEDGQFEIRVWTKVWFELVGR